MSWIDLLVARIGKQYLLAISLLGYLVADAVWPGNRLVAYGVLILMVISGPMAVSQVTWQRRLALLLALLMVLPGLASAVRPATSVQLVSLAMGLAFFCLLIYVIARNLMVQRTTVTAETLWAAINVYLLLGMLFAFIYAVADLTLVDAFSGKDYEPGLNGEPDLYLYFSFVTMTTLGYGDVTPAVPITERLALVQALIGQLYVAILIARLVSLYSANPPEEQS